MDRRKAVKFLLFAAGATAVAVPAFQWYKNSRKADLSDLVEYKDLLNELAETIIPRTETPGAKDAKVGEFIYKMVMDCTDTKSQNKFVNGLHDIEVYSNSKYGASFTKCTTEQKETILVHFEKQGKPRISIWGKIRRKFLGLPFFTTLKEYTVLGYCTSQQGANSALDYDYVPKQFIACMTVEPTKKSWATK